MEEADKDWMIISSPR